MAMMFIDGFDEYSSGLSKYTGQGGGSGSVDLSGVNSRTGAGAWHAIGSGGPFLSFTGRSRLIAGMAVKPPGTIGSGVMGFYSGGVFNINSVTQARVLTTSLGQVVVVNNNVPFQTPILTSAPNLVFGGVYCYIEIDITFSRLAGSITLRLNGATIGTASGINTDPAGTGVVDTFQIDGPAGGLSTFMDDLYLFDASGGVNNALAGACRVFTALPTSDNAPLQWTPSSAGTHFNLVNGVPAENQISYVQTPTVGQIDNYLYNVAALPANATILGVQHGLYAELDTSGSGSIGSECGNTLQGSVGVTTSPHIYSFPRDTDPVAVGPWTLTNLTSRPFGPNRTA